MLCYRWQVVKPCNQCGRPRNRAENIWCRQPLDNENQFLLLFSWCLCSGKLFGIAALNACSPLPTPLQSCSLKQSPPLLPTQWPGSLFQSCRWQDLLASVWQLHSPTSRGLGLLLCKAGGKLQEGCLRVQCGAVHCGPSGPENSLRWPTVRAVVDGEHSLHSSGSGFHGKFWG